MRKPDIFDEIIAALAEKRGTPADTSMDPEVLQAFYRPATPRPKPVPQPVPPQTDDFDKTKYSIDVESSRLAAEMPQPVAPPPAAAPAPRRRTATRPAPAMQHDTNTNPDPRRHADMDYLRQLALECHTCRLCETRTNVVFEDGNRNARLMFIGEGPGADEDAQGVPFVGRAGQLLTRMIQSMGFDRATQVYIANIVKCRPPQNRNPFDDEAYPCLPFLQRQIELVQPEVIVLLGAVPLQYLMGLKGLGKVRGQWLDYRGFKVMATYHPAYLLRNPPAKADAWADLKKVMAVFGHVPDPRYR